MYRQDGLTFRPNPPLGSITDDLENGLTSYQPVWVVLLAAASLFFVGRVVYRKGKPALKKRKEAIEL